MLHTQIGSHKATTLNNKTTKVYNESDTLERYGVRACVISIGDHMISSAIWEIIALSQV